MTSPCKILVALLLFSALSTAASADSPVDPFPSLPALEGNVGFWVHVFSEWSLGQAAIHDLEHPAVVYEVVDLPGAIGASYTVQQREFLEDVRAGWKAYLEQVQAKLVDGRPLDEVEQRWVEHIREHAGHGALEAAHERVRSQRGLRERFRDGLERSYRHDATIREILRDEGLPEDLAYLPHVESSFQYHARSSAGATGLWQFTRGTGRRYLTINSAVDERLDPIAATRGAARYLRDAYDKLGSWPLALTSYNHGVQGMLRARARFGDDFERIYREYDGRLFGFASKNFYAEFLAAREIAGRPDHYFPEGYTPEPTADLESVVLDRRATPARIAARHGVDLPTLASLNPAWSRRAVRHGLAIPAGTQVWLPPGSLARARSIPEPAGRIGDDGLYVVERGDTLSRIAAAYGVSVARLRETNEIDRAGLIRVGQKLHLADDPPTVVHVVHRGETLSDIAATYGIGLDDLRHANGMSASDSLIRAGQELRLVPGARAVNHTVRRGDTLSDIAARYGVSVASLRSANGIRTRDSLIQVGQRLRVPGGTPPAVRHVVRHGENPTRIARTYGVRVLDLLSANMLTLRSVIHPGQTLLIPD